MDFLGKILFGRSHIREVALKRLSPLDEYLKVIITDYSFSSYTYNDS